MIIMLQIGGSRKKSMTWSEKDRGGGKGAVPHVADLGNNLNPEIVTELCNITMKIIT